VATFGVAAVDVAVIQRALALGWTDFEDAVTAAAAEAARCDAVVTRDPKGFAGSTLPVMSAETAVALLAGDLPEGVDERPTTRHRRPRARH